MDYRKSYDEKALLKMNINEALDCIRAECGENLLKVNNEYCDAKYKVIGDVFWGFPASDTYDERISAVVPIGREIIRLSSGLQGVSLDIKKQFLNRFFEEREKLKVAMKAL